jgi:hypothetical protein
MLRLQVQQLRLSLKLTRQQRTHGILNSESCGSNNIQS